MRIFRALMALGLLVTGVVSTVGSGGGGGGGGGDGALNWLRISSNYYPAVIAEDINGDGAVDIAFTEEVTTFSTTCANPFEDPPPCIFGPTTYGHFVRLYLQNKRSPGTFQAPEKYKLSSRAFSIASADFDLDGIPDLAIPQRFDGKVKVLSDYGMGSGGFQSDENYAVNIDPLSIAAGDLNADNRPDIAVGGEDLILLENRSNSRGFNQRSLGIPNVTSIAIADINADGRNDLAVISRDALGVISEDTVIVLLQDSPPAVPGNFTLSQKYADGNYPVDIALADLNNDSLIDMAVTNIDYMEHVGGVSVYNQNPANLGEFFPAVLYEKGMNALDVSIADLNNDFLPDIAVLNASYDQDGEIISDGTSILFQDQLSHGVFLSAVYYPVETINISNGIDTEDLNGDLLMDIVVADKISGSSTPYIYFQDIDNPGVFSGPVNLP